MVLLSTKRKVLSAILLSLSTATFLLTCTAIAKAQPQSVSILGIEVTQGIQSMGEGNPRDSNQDNLIPLVKNRKTWVRVYFSKPGSYRASLVVSNEPNGQGTQLKSLNNGRMVAGLGNREKLLRSSLNFEVPTSLVKGDSIAIQSIAVVNSAGNPHPRFTCDNCSSYLTTFSPLPLAEGFPLKLRLIGLSYEAEGSPPVKPTETEFQQIVSWLKRTYPVTGVSLFPSRPITAPVSDIVPYDTTQGKLFEEEGGISLGCYRTNEQLRLLKQADLDANQTNDSEYQRISQTRYVGTLSDGGFPADTFIRGCTNGNPDTNPDIMATAPVGTTENRFGWDDDHFYGDWQVAHELGHTYGQSHLIHPDPCGATEFLDNRDTRISPEQPSQPRYVGLDFGDTIRPVGSGAIKVLRRRAIRGAWHDFMSYCPKSSAQTDNSKWINPYSYSGILNALIEDNSSIGRTASTAQHLLTSTNGTAQSIPQPVPEELPKQNSLTPLSFHIEKGRFVTALAKIDPSNKQKPGSLTYVQETTLTRIRSQQDQADIQLRITFKQREPIVRPMALQKYPDARSQKYGIGTAEVNISIDEQPLKIELLIKGAVADEIIVSPDNPIFDKLSVDHPLNPGVGFSHVKRPVRLQWEAHLPHDLPGPNPTTLTYTIQMSYDQGRSWHTIAINLKNKQFELSPDRLQGADNVQVKIIASDRFNTTEKIVSISGVLPKHFSPYVR